jgi:nuclear factor related to kappa-B-binding protein
MQAYQWIGAGCDSDHHLAPLCSHWLERRNEVPAVPVREEEQTEEAGLSSPPPRCPTTWQARSAVGAERDSFHAQVRLERLAHTSAGLTKPRGHTLLVSERPNYITILSLGNIE